MKIIKSLITLLIVIIVGILVFFFIYRTDEARKEQEAFERNLIRFDLDHILSFSLVKPDTSIVFERGIGRIWNITSPIVSEASGDMLKEIFTSLYNSKIIFTVEENPDDLSKYGLENPKFFLAMEYENGENDTLYSGNTTPDGSMSYIRFATENRILTADKTLINKLNYSVNSYRARTILNIIDDDVTALEIIRNGNEVIRLQYDGVNWYMKEPWQLEADQRNIRALIKEIADSKKGNFIAEKTDDLAQYGLDDPSVIFTVKLKYGMPDKMLLVGKKPDSRAAQHLWYAKQFDNDLIFTAPNELIDKFNYIIEWFINKNPMKFQQGEITRIVMETGTNSITFLKDAQRNWSVISPVDKNLREEVINKIYGMSRFILINRLFTAEPTEQELITAGLDNPFVQIAFFKNDTQVAKIYFGDTIVGDNTKTYFKIESSPVIYLTTVDVTSDINYILDRVFGE